MRADCSTQSPLFWLCAMRRITKVRRPWNSKRSRPLAYTRKLSDFDVGDQPSPAKIDMRPAIARSVREIRMNAPVQRHCRQNFTTLCRGDHANVPAAPRQRWVEASLPERRNFQNSYLLERVLPALARPRVRGLHQSASSAQRRRHRAGPGGRWPTRSRREDAKVCLGIPGKILDAYEAQGLRMAKGPVRRDRAARPACNMCPRRLPAITSSSTSVLPSASSTKRKPRARTACSKKWEQLAELE